MISRLFGFSRSRSNVRRVVLLSTLGLSLLIGGGVRGQAPQPPTPQPQPPTPTPQPPTPQPGQPPAGQPGQPPAGFPGGRPQTSTTKPRPYAEVITKEAKTDEGLITTHQIDDKVFFEIPTAILGKEVLWVTTLRETQIGAGYGGQEVQDRVVRWEKRGDKILLRGVDFQVRAVNKEMEQSVALSAVEPILQVFDIKAYNKDKGDAAVIEVTPFLTSDPSEFSPRRRLNVTRIDAQRTFIDKVKSLPQNVELDVLATYIAAAPTIPGLPGIPFPGGPQGPRRDSSTDAVTAVVHHSIVLLPEKPMMPRLSDDRVGYFTTSYWEFGNPRNRVDRVRYISRWRLEKKDPNAAVSEPVKPITYYIGPEVPEKWRKYIKQGVEDWQPVFEKAGFKNAIVCKLPQDEQGFDPDDVRYSVIRWFPSAIENAYGPSIVDPRSGEILNANPRFYYNVMKLAQTWYFAQASPSDKRAQKLPLPDELIGDLLRYIVSHEIGHTLGLQHNMKASSSYSVAQLRDPKFTSEYGDEASIMDYGRFNYVAQPEDKVTRLIPKIGPYDYFAIQWGYQPIKAANPEAEKPTLNTLASKQSTDPTLRFGPGFGDDPTQQTEDLGSDGVEATRLGLLNIDRVLGYLVTATSEAGENYDLLEEMYQAVLGQRETELGHVITIIGGYVQTTTYYNQAGATNPANYAPVPVARQRAAMKLLVDSVFTTPKNLIRADILNRIEPGGISDRVLSSQLMIMARLLSDSKIKRMTEQEAVNGAANTYTAAEMVGTMTQATWGELYQKTAAPLVIDPYRRNLQRIFITVMGTKLTSTTSDMRPLARGILMEVQASIKASLSRAQDRVTRFHLMDCDRTIENLLNPK